MSGIIKLDNKEIIRIIQFKAPNMTLKYSFLEKEYKNLLLNLSPIKTTKVTQAIQILKRISIFVEYVSSE